MLNNKSQIKRRARRFFTQRACFSAVADCTSTISGASLFQSRVTTLPATLKTCSDLEDAAGMAKMTLKIGARMNNGLQKIIEKSVYCKVKIPNQNKTLTSALTYCLPRPAPPRHVPFIPDDKTVSLRCTPRGTFPDRVKWWKESNFEKGQRALEVYLRPVFAEERVSTTENTI